ncbi:histidine kinase [Pelomonas sp. CA6]|uniref:sensor histidine kinase n=1 Tax=Pelomonas sp. CA6 TaxID=2907999 RepID=UPI001F4AA683|nr:histidine kinase [Pelomonas sp. CA6]MCH7342387.1 histidine kinase [Pelomonas sp. CA6]
MIPAPKDWPRWWLQQVLILVLVTVGITALLMLVFRQRLLPTLTYTFFITLCCSVCTQSLRILLARLLRRDGGEWPGWPLMMLSLVLGTGLGYSLGNEIANAVTGYNEAGLHNTSLRRALTIMAISLLPGLALTVFFLNRQRLAAAEARAQTMQRQVAETQLALLQSQLEPHMLFNTLANLRVLISMDAARAQQMLDHLIAFLRATLTASRAARHSLKDEFGRLADYLALMQVRMGARLRPELELPAALETLPVPPLLLQPLVENAIKHGLEPHVGGGLLRVQAHVDGDTLRLRVEDDGRGLAAPASPRGAPATPGTGFGTQQVRERLAVCYGDAAQFLLLPRDGGGTRAEIRIPLAALAGTDSQAKTC